MEASRQRFGFWFQNHDLFSSDCCPVPLLTKLLTTRSEPCADRLSTRRKDRRMAPRSKHEGSTSVSANSDNPNWEFGHPSLVAIYEIFISAPSFPSRIFTR